MTYCFAIRARDEKPNYGPWSFIEASTLGAAGDWDLGARFRVANKAAANSLQLAFPNPDLPVLGWVLAGGTAKTHVEFAAPGWGPIPPIAADPISRIDSFRMVAIPNGSGRVAAVVAGRGSDRAWTVHYQLVEAGGSQSPTITSIVSGAEMVGGLAGSPDSSITYIERDGDWNPVIAVDAVIGQTKIGGNRTVNRTQLRTHRASRRYVAS